MTLMKIRFAVFSLLLAASSFSVAQNPTPQASPAAQKPSSAPEAVAPAKKANGGIDASKATAVAGKVPAIKEADRAQAYYHYSMAHIYEELVTSYARSEFANKAIEEYKLALQYDPNSPYLNAGLAELYAKTGRIKEAVLEAQDIIKRDPTNIEARRLLGRSEHDSPEDPGSVRVRRDSWLHAGRGGGNFYSDSQKRSVGERGETERPPDLGVVHPALDVLPSDRVPER